MNIHVILSGDARSYLGLKTSDLKPVSEIPEGIHWYGVWRMDKRMILRLEKWRSIVSSEEIWNFDSPTDSDAKKMSTL